MFRVFGCGDGRRGLCGEHGLCKGQLKDNELISLPNPKQHKPIQNAGMTMHRGLLPTIICSLRNLRSYGA